MRTQKIFNGETELVNINDITADEYARAYSLMSAEKKQRVDRFRFDEDKKRSTAGEILARKLISAHCGTPAESIAFCTGEQGKPFANGLDVELNISHSGEIVICTVSDKPVGIDVEMISDINTSVADRFCTDSELAFLRDKSITHAEALNCFYRIWTFKEAYLKRAGTGIANVDLKSAQYPADAEFAEFKTDKAEYIICLYK